MTQKIEDQLQIVTKVPSDSDRPRPTTTERSAIDLAAQKAGSDAFGEVTVFDTGGRPAFEIRTGPLMSIDPNARPHGVTISTATRVRHGDNDRVVILPESGTIKLKDKDGQEVVTISLDSASLVVGAPNKAGTLTVLGKDGKPAFQILIDGAGRSFTKCAALGADDIRCGDDSGDVFLRCFGGRLYLIAGGKATFSADAPHGDVRLGGNGVDGDLLVFPGGADPSDNGKAVFHVDGQAATITGRRTDGKVTFTANAQHGNVRLGGNGSDGDLLLFASGGDPSKDGQATVHLDGNSGDIKLAGADCAERFDLQGGAVAAPGTVLVVGEAEALVPCKGGYDRRVAGVVSGAGANRPGMVLNAQAGEGAVPIALIGRVHCWVDAGYGAIEVGDLLTTSPTEGHAMKASDPGRTLGSVLGKALRPLASGRGLIPILVALQ